MFFKKKITPLQEFSLGALRIALGLIFLWAFVDKVFGLGFATEPGKAWLNGVSPTYGFLKFGTRGIFASVFQLMAGNALVDWLFMIGLLLIGLALILGIGTALATYFGSLLLFLMYLALLPPEHHPLLDDHIIYILALIVLHAFHAGDSVGFGKIWKKNPLVKKYPFLA